MKKYLIGFTIGLIITSAVTSFARSRFFADIQSGAWYENAVYQLADIGVISGYNDGTFKPGRNVTRAEVSQMMLRMKEYVDARVEGRTVMAPQQPASPPSPIAPIASNSSPSCSVLTPPPHYREIAVGTVAELKNAVASANENGNVTITLKNGTYTLDQSLWVSGSSIFFRSQSGNRDGVIVRGDGMNGGVNSVFQLAGKNITIADMTVGWVANHPIQIHGELDADGPRIHNLHITDGHEQLLKVSYDADNTALGSDNGIVECSLFDYSAGVGPQYYIGGVDAHNAKNWIVRNNVFKNITSPEEDLAEHAIHFWSNSQGTLVEGNTIINSDRGIGFGLGDTRGHSGGIIRNNFIYHNSSRGDVGIGLETARDAQVYNNTIFFDNDYQNAIEYRFTGSRNVNIHDNVTNKSISARDGGSATVRGNIVNAMSSWFTNTSAGDLHLNATGLAQVNMAGAR